MAIISFIVFSLDGIDGYLVVLHERRRDIVLRGKGVGRAQDDIRAPRFQSLNEISRLRGDVQGQAEKRIPRSTST